MSVCVCLYVCMCMCECVCLCTYGNEDLHPIQIPKLVSKAVRGAIFRVRHTCTAFVLIIRVYTLYLHVFVGPSLFRFPKGLTTLRIAIKPFEAQISIETSNTFREYV